MGFALQVTVELRNVQCWCGMAFAVPSELYSSIQEQRGSIRQVYCPVGHTLTWTETEVTRLKRQLEQKEKELVFARAQKDRAEASARASRGQVTKLQNRIKNGVCPHCNRHFTNVERHMRSKHPQQGDSVA